MDKLIGDLGGHPLTQQNHVNKTSIRSMEKSTSIRKEKYVTGKILKNIYVCMHFYSHINLCIYMYISLYVCVYISICIYLITKVACLIQILCADEISQVRLY